MFRTLLGYLGAGPNTILFSLLIIIVSPFSRSGRLMHRLAVVWAKHLLFLTGVKVTITGGKEIRPGENYIFASNHQSAFDILALLACLPVSFRWLAKDSLFHIPVFGWAMKQAGYIPIEREKGRSAYESLIKAAEKIEKGVSVVIFPEGTRSEDGTLGPFKPGGFVLAIKSQRPMIPVTIMGSHLIMPKGTLKLRPGFIQVNLGHPIPTRGLSVKDKGKLMENMRTEIIKGYGN